MGNGTSLENGKVVGVKGWITWNQLTAISGSDNKASKQNEISTRHNIQNEACKQTHERGRRETRSNELCCARVLSLRITFEHDDLKFSLNENEFDNE